MIDYAPLINSVRSEMFIENRLAQSLNSVGVICFMALQPSIDQLDKSTYHSYGVFKAMNVPHYKHATPNGVRGQFGRAKIFSSSLI